MIQDLIQWLSSFGGWGILAALLFSILLSILGVVPGSRYRSFCTSLGTPARRHSCLVGGSVGLRHRFPPLTQRIPGEHRQGIPGLALGPLPEQMAPKSAIFLCAHRPSPPLHPRRRDQSTRRSHPPPIQGLSPGHGPWQASLHRLGSPHLPRPDPHSGAGPSVGTGVGGTDPDLVGMEEKNKRGGITHLSGLSSLDSQVPDPHPGFGETIAFTILPVEHLS